MRPHDPPVPRRALGSAEDPDVEAIPWVSAGAAAGVLGAAILALVFGIVDVLAGRPLWTPFALGAAFFRGALPPEGSAIEPALVVGYTILHGAVFVGAGVLAAFEILAGTRLPGPAATRGLLLAALLFLLFEIVFVAFALLFAPGAMALLGAGRVAFANLVAAGAMSALLYVRRARSGIDADGPR